MGAAGGARLELARLAALYAKQQHALKKTEAELGLLLGNIGVHEPRRNMGSALNLCADMLRRSSKRREDLVVQCATSGRTRRRAL